MARRDPFIVGVTGHRGSGKTAVCKMMAALGAYRIDADDIVHELYDRGNIGARLIERNFGSKMVNRRGTVDRDELYDFVREDVKNLVLLNSLIHPLVKNVLSEKLLSLSLNKRIIVIEAAYFEEDVLLDLVDYLIYVDADEDYIDWQEPFSSYLEKFYRANTDTFDAILRNDSSLADLKESVVEIFKSLPYK